MEHSITIKIKAKDLKEAEAKALSLQIIGNNLGADHLKILAGVAHKPQVKLMIPQIKNFV